MAEYQKSGLTTKLNTDLANNSDGAITAEDIRGNMINIVDSVHIIMSSGQNYFMNDLEIFAYNPQELNIKSKETLGRNFTEHERSFRKDYFSCDFGIQGYQKIHKYHC